MSHKISIIKVTPCFRSVMVGGLFALATLIYTNSLMSYLDDLQNPTALQFAFALSFGFAILREVSGIPVYREISAS